MQIARTSWLWVLVLLAAGCASGHRPKESARFAAAIAAPTSLTILRGADGSRSSWDELLAACSEADAVLVGEMHGQRVGQAFQASFFEELLARAPNAAAALEFFERDDQAALDDYLLGVTDEAAFRRASRRTKNNYPSGHEAMVEACKAAGRPVIAANASRRYVRLARLEGFERLRELSAEQQRLFRVPEVVPEGRYRDDFFKVMGGKDLLADPHGAEPDAAKDAADEERDAERRARIAESFRSQSVWDWTMAESVARAIDEGARPVVLVVGRFHIDHGGGLVQALERLRPGTKVVTVSNVDGWSEELREDDQERAGFVVYVGEE